MTDLELEMMEARFAEEDAAYAAMATARAKYESLRAELESVESATGLYLFDHNVNAENIRDGGFKDEGKAEFWEMMECSACMMAGNNAEEAGQNINAILGRVIY
jgi:hypothetical protein